jgi:multidrug efflux system outer membrane protein
MISLTSTLGFASTALSALFTGGELGASGSPAATLSILGGASRGSLDYAKAQRDYSLARRGEGWLDDEGDESDGKPVLQVA